MKFSVSLSILSALITPAFAVVNIDYLSVGNTGNHWDTTGYNAISYAYNINKYVLTNPQHGEFLNAKGASDHGTMSHSGMTSSGMTQTGNLGNFSYKVNSSLANNPVANFSWDNGEHFTQSMMNSQGSSDMESDACTLTRTTAIMTKNIVAQVYLPSEYEWYKAAYDTRKDSAYSLYPNGQSRIAYWDAAVNSSESTNVGRYYRDANSYAAFSQGGVVAEWNEAVIFAQSLGVRGGNWFDDYNVRSANSCGFLTKFESDGIGFSVTSVPVSTAIVLMVLASGTMLIRRRR
jgi:sulfatase modifying factor 1